MKRITHGQYNLEIFPGEIVAIAGTSGIGRSTLLGTIAGLIRPISGSIKCVVPKSPQKNLSVAH